MSELDASFNASISNDEIRRRLTHDFKVECGPVTPSTRRVLLKRLAKLEKNQSSTPGVALDNSHRHDETNGSDTSINQVDDSLIINGKHDNGDHLQNDSLSRARFGEITRTPRKNSPRRYSPRRKTTEEIEAIKSFNDVNKELLKKQQLQQSVSQQRLKNKNARNAIVSTVSLNDSTPKLNQYSSESSESEDDSPIENTPPAIHNTPAISTSFLTSRVVFPRIFGGDHGPKLLTRPPIRRTTIDSQAKTSSLLNYSDSESDVEELKNDKLCKMLLSHRPGLGRTAPSKKASVVNKVKAFYYNLKQKFISQPAADTANNLNFSASSNFISLALLIFVAIFFVVIFSVYFYAKFTFNSKHTLDLNDYAFIEDKAKLVAPICTGALNENDCLEFESDCKPALNIVKGIKAYIDKAIHDDYCVLNQSPAQDDISSFKFKIDEIEKQLANKVQFQSVERDPSLATLKPVQQFDRDFRNAIMLLKLNPSWNLEMSDSITFSDTISPSPSYTLQLPFKCNFWIFLRINLWSIIVAGLTVCMPTAVYFYYRQTKKAASEEQSQVYDLIDKAIELLQSPDEPQSMPVLHIRDTLLSPSERKSAKYRRVWNKVVNHIENSDSRVKVEFKKMDGEDFKAWKWIATNTGASYMLNDNEMDMDGTLAPGSHTQKIGGVEWQGQAFGSVLASGKSSPSRNPESSDHNESLTVPSIGCEAYRGKNFSALTRFLKIRNIFEKEAHFLDPNWAKKIKNTILEKTAKTSPTGSHDIVHIEIEDNPSEGLVYLKCASIPAATNAFHALHGWWCEKKLVSVKFLREDRYNQRFPLAKRANTPLEIESIN